MVVIVVDILIVKQLKSTVNQLEHSKKLVNKPPFLNQDWLINELVFFNWRRPCFWLAFALQPSPLTTTEAPRVTELPATDLPVTVTACQRFHRSVPPQATPSTVTVTEDMETTNTSSHAGISQMRWKSETLFPLTETFTQLIHTTLVFLPCNSARNNYLNSIFRYESSYRSPHSVDSAYAYYVDGQGVQVARTDVHGKYYH